MSHAPDVNPVIDAVVGRTLPATANMLSLGAIAVGIGAFLFGMFAGGPEGVAWSWGAVLVGIVYTLALAQGGVMYGVIMTGTWARWGRPLKRIAETFGLFMPFVWLALAVFLIGGIGIYAWNPDTIIVGGAVALEPHSPEAYASKPRWLQKWFFIGRDLLGVGWLVLLDLIWVRASMRPDLIQAKARLGDRAPGWWSSIIGGETDLVAATKASLDTQSKLMPLMALSYALVMSMLAFDLLMSLSPWWFSNMFGAWVFVSSFWVSMACLAVTTMVSRDWLHIGPFVKRNVTHDLGKLMLAGCMFWAYTTFSQLLPIWYTDMPEETDYLLVRMFLPQWSWLAQTVAITCFLAPFTVLLSRGVKKMRWPFAAVGLLIMTGIFLERSLLVYPSIFKAAEFPWMNFAITSFGVWFGFLGAFAQVVGRVLAQVPGICVSDPYLETHPWEVHIHSLDHGHGQGHSHASH
jgi:hypothetical protein